jgi:Flp pilus assembly protein TadB
MPTRKQRRRRQKDRRHEYEFVYVDEQGEEVEVDPEDGESPAQRRNGRRESRPQAKKTSKRALIFAPLIFLAFSFINSGQSIGTRLLVTVVYTAFFVPFMYLMDRAMYRSYLKRTGQLPQRQPRKR